MQKRTKLIFRVAFLSALSLAFVLGAFFFAPAGYESFPQEAPLFFLSNETLFLAQPSGAVRLADAPQNQFHEITIASDQSRIFYWQEANAALFVAPNSPSQTPIEIDVGVSSPAVCKDGSCVIYLKDTQEKKAALHSYSMENQEALLLGPADLLQCFLSPSGKSIAYTKAGIADGKLCLDLYWMNGESKETKIASSPAVSDLSQMQCQVQWDAEENCLFSFLQKGSQNAPLFFRQPGADALFIDNGSNALLFADGTLFFEKEGALFCAKGTGSPQKIAQNATVLPKETGCLVQTETQLLWAEQGQATLVCPLSGQAEIALSANEQLLAVSQGGASVCFRKEKGSFLKAADLPGATVSFAFARPLVYALGQDGALVSWNAETGERATVATHVSAYCLKEDEVFFLDAQQKAFHITNEATVALPQGGKALFPGEGGIYLLQENNDLFFCSDAAATKIASGVSLLP